MRLLILFLICFLFFGRTQGQKQYEIKGSIMDRISQQFLGKVLITLSVNNNQVFSDEAGFFSITTFSNTPDRLELVSEGYEKVRIPVSFPDSLAVVNIGIIGLNPVSIENNRDEWIELDQEELEGNSEDSNYITGVLSASKSLFARTAAFDFSMTFFKPRNVGTEYSTVMLNGVKLNKIFNNRPEWSNWGGLNDALRNQEVYPVLMSSPYGMGSLSTGMNMISSASRQRKVLKISFAASNKNYLNRLMATYSSGPLSKGWSYTFSASLRVGDEGFRSGTMYKAYSGLVSVDKQIGNKHLLNASFIYANNERGKSAPLTQEVYELKDIKYNSYWGMQEGRIRNSRIKRVVEPIFQLNYDFNINASTHFHSHLTYQIGNAGSSRLDYGGGRWLEESQSIIGGGNNPDPTYYQKLPSYFLRDMDDPNYTGAYLAEKEFLSDGQVKWAHLYEANQQPSNKGNSIYVLYEDRHDDVFLSIDSGIHKKFNGQFSMDASINMVLFTSENYAYMMDLLGGSGYLDVDTYADNWLEAQSNLLEINRIVVENEKFKYNYELKAGLWNAFVKGDYASRKVEAFLAFGINSSSYQRIGIYENGAFPNDSSLGKSKKVDFKSLSFKTGLTYKLNGRHIFYMNANYLERAPAMQNVFSNVRQNNDIVLPTREEKALAFDGSYLFRHPNVTFNFSVYYLSLKDQSKISFYYADGLTGLENSNTNAYVQEVMTGIDKSKMGIELSLEVPVLMNIKLKGVAAIGRSAYSNNPNLYLTSDDFDDPVTMGTSYLKNYFVGGGPQRAYSLGFEYSSPSYWWFGLSFNHFEHAYIGVAPILRTKNFYSDADGQPINNFDPEVAEVLLEQETIAPYSILNLVGGKSWKFGNKYAGFFVSINNLTKTLYKTGGFEQARNANYTTLLEDKSREKPLFGPKYWFGYGTTFFTSIYFRI